jgi:hypothetical protein
VQVSLDEYDGDDAVLISAAKETAS